MGPRADLDGAENLVPTGIRSRTVQPVAQLLYRLSYRVRNILFLLYINKVLCYRLTRCIYILQYFGLENIKKEKIEG